MDPGNLLFVQFYLLLCVCCLYSIDVGSNHFIRRENSTINDVMFIIALSIRVCGYEMLLNLFIYVMMVS